MPPVVNADLFLAAIIGGWEILLFVAVVLVIFIAKRLPEMGRGLSEGLRRFWNVTRNLGGTGFDAGKSIGGIYGKPAAQAIAHDNRVAEFYNVDDDRRTGPAARLFKLLLRPFRRFLRWLLRIR